MELVGFKAVTFVLCVIGYTAICGRKTKGRQYFSCFFKLFGLCCGIAAGIIALSMFKEGGCWAIILAVVCWLLIRWGTLKFVK